MKTFYIGSLRDLDHRDLYTNLTWKSFKQVMGSSRFKAEHYSVQTLQCDNGVELYKQQVNFIKIAETLTVVSLLSRFALAHSYLA
jgi:hypothetical protein